MHFWRLSETTKYTVYGVLFGLCFPIGTLITLAVLGHLDDAGGAYANLVAAHHSHPLLYVIDSASLFLALFAGIAGNRQERIKRFSGLLEIQVDKKTESLKRALQEAQRANEKIAHMAEHDTLTGLLNRRCFQKELDHWIEYAIRYERNMALVFIDLDNFKKVNDIYGHAAGDEYLTFVADILKRTFRSTDFLARWGGDEFAVLLPETTAETAAHVANKVLSLFNKSKITIQDQQIQISGSIGIALFPNHTSSPNELIAYADAAMYQAKISGSNRWHMYSKALNSMERLQELISWEARLRKALEADQFFLHYQPVINLRTSKTSNYEVLLRMEDREGRHIQPGTFLGYADQFNLSIPIDRMVIKKAINKLLTIASHNQDLWLSINLSRKTLIDGALFNFIQETVADAGIRASQIGFELSEHLLLENMGQVRELSTGFMRYGFKLILDDFGLGFSSFRFLQQISVSIIKIDGALIHDIKNSKENQRFIKTLTSMAHDLGIHVVAKFVEDQELLPLLRKLNVDFAQGFAIGKPIESIEQAIILEKSAAG